MLVQLVGDTPLMLVVATPSQATRMLTRITLPTNTAEPWLIRCATTHFYLSAYVSPHVYTYRTLSFTAVISCTPVPVCNNEPFTIDIVIISSRCGQNREKQVPVTVRQLCRQLHYHHRVSPLFCNCWNSVYSIASRRILVYALSIILFCCFI